MSMTSAPWAASNLPRRIAASPLRQTLSRYHESGERLITPMRYGRPLNANCLPPIVNSLTRAFAASRFFSSSAANCSRSSMLFPGLGSDGQLHALAFAHHCDRHRLADFHGIECVRVVVDIRDLLPAELDD